MSRIGFIREQTYSPTVPEQAIVVDDPQEISRPAPSRPPMWVWVVIFIAGAIGLMVMLYISGARQLSTGAFFIFPMMMVSMVMMMRNRGGGQKLSGAQKNQNRADYLRKLDELRADTHDAARAQAREINHHHPDPRDGSLATLVGSARMWERAPGVRGNWGHVRVGLGVTRLKTKLTPPTKVPPEDLRETVTTVAARDFLRAQNVIHDVPRPLHLFDQMGWSWFYEPGQRAVVQGMLRAMVCQLCVFHGPDDVKVAVITDDPAAWEWAKWLPHTADEEYVDACGPLRSIFGDVKTFLDRHARDVQSRPPFAPLMEGVQPPQRWLVVVVDLPGADCSPILGDAGRLGVSVLEATNDERSVLANAECAFIVDGIGNLLRADGGEVR